MYRSEGIVSLACSAFVAFTFYVNPHLYQLQINTEIMILFVFHYLIQEPCCSWPPFLNLLAVCVAHETVFQLQLR